MTLRFNLLGPFEIVNDEGKCCTPHTPKVCQVLALVLTRPNEMVSVESFIQELWGEEPPRSALTTLQTYVYHARKLFAESGMEAPGEPRLVTRAPGYMIRVEDHELDVLVFEQMVRQGRRSLQEEEEAEVAAKLLREALGMWRGPTLANIAVGPVLSAQITYLSEIRIRAAELSIEAEKRLGRHRELVPELRSLVREYPYNEWFHGQLMDVLSLSGRRAEALQAYQDLRGILADELGMEPSPEIQQLQRRVLGSPLSSRSSHRAYV
ncbi:AfsR/SARP family transcriptional regulator [Streptomyces sp. TP-A0874]|uniref:AfsR/SARP family transcriptional regulator n=1 Tax=Streptomyces sp. TP-A0874 TaxID=549819 RepID=UPI001FCD0C50|nr:AfsR/SARP family transcriptional regulator [Streptomyces sp. TP-A0874]